MTSTVKVEEGKPNIVDASLVERPMGGGAPEESKGESSLDYTSESEGSSEGKHSSPPLSLKMRRALTVGVLGDHQQRTTAEVSSAGQSAAAAAVAAVALLHEEPLEVQCGEKTALLFVSKLCQGSKGPCILYGNEWLTPNELQYICGRETAKDWKRSIRHKGKSLKSLIAQGFLKVHPPICDCPGCRVSSPVNRTRLADKCGFSKMPSFLSDKTMVEGFPTMWRRNSTSSDEPDHATMLHSTDAYGDDDVPQQKRAHSDEPRYYQPSDQISMIKRPRSSSPDLDRGRFHTKRRTLSDVCPDSQEKAADAPRSSAPSRYADELSKSERLFKVGDTELKRDHVRMGAIRSSLVKDIPVLTIPSTAYPANVLYAHNQTHLGLHRHVTSPRLLSPTFVRPSATAAASSAQVRLLHEQASPLSAAYAAQQLRQDYPGMATVFPYTFTHPLPGNQLISAHFPAKLTTDTERHIANTGDPKSEEPKVVKENEVASRGSSPANGSSPKTVDSDTRHRSPTDDSNVKLLEMAEDEGRPYRELATITAQWGIDEVCKFVDSVTGCTDYSDVFREQEIDGQAFVLLTEEHLSNKMGIKLGPALKIKSKIDELRCVYTK